MGYIFSDLQLGTEFEDYFFQDSPAEEINSLGKVNIFIGANNSGKSRFMRQLCKTNGYSFKQSDINYDEFVKGFEAMADEINQLLKHEGNFAIVEMNIGGKLNVEAGALDLKEYVSNFFLNEDSLSDKKNGIAQNFNLKRLIQIVKFFKGGQGNKNNINSTRGNHHNTLSIFPQVKSILEKYPKVLKALDLIEKQGVTDFKKIYIPIFRSLNYFRDSDTKIIEERIEESYKIKEGGAEIFTGESLYEKVKAMLLGNHEDRSRISDYENFLSEKVFDRQQVSLIPRVDDKVLHVRIGQEEKPIFDLGDGIQNLIILTFLLFEYDKALFFIEEPEANLHPGMQRRFIEVLQEFKGHQFFLTTHSNHFLDTTIDYTNISIYTFQKRKELSKKKEPTFSVNLVSSGEENALSLLGAQSTSVFLSNATIWVEGITDRLYIRKFLELYQKQENKALIKEDVDYSFVEYAGGNITHWSFLESEHPTIDVKHLCSKLFLITDKDGDSKLERKSILKRNLGTRYQLLECEEIENILSLETLERVIASYERTAGNDEFCMPAFRSSYPHKEEKLGAFIQGKVFRTQNCKRRGGYKAESGTIKDKLTFCKKTIEELTYEEMTPPARALAKKIYDFVMRQKR